MTDRQDNPPGDSRRTVVVIDLIRNAFGGIEQVMLLLLPLLNQKWRVVFIDLYSHPEHARILRQNGVEVVHLLPPPRRNYVGGKGTWLRPLLVAAKLPWLLLTLVKLRRWLRSNRPDVVYFNRYEVARICLPVIGPALPALFHAHGYRSAGDLPQKLLRLLRDRFGHIVAVSHYTARCLVEAGIAADKISVVHNAIDAPAFRAASLVPGPPLPVRRADEVIFVHVAVLTELKRQSVSIEALGALQTKNTRLWICGDIPDPGGALYRESLRQKVRELGLTPRVEFLGWRSDVARVLREADVALLPSEFEGLPISVLEAMALGKPCIGTSRGGVPDLIEDGSSGFLCEPAAPQFTRAMERMAGSADLREACGQQAMRRVETLFSPLEQSARVSEALERVLAARPTE